MQKTLAEIARALDTDKPLSPGYIDNYERHLGHLRDAPVRLLELGVYHGGSLRMWQEYFPNGSVAGLDLEPNPLTEMPERVRFYQGSQDDERLLERVARECAPDGFDVIIDDASHIGRLARASFRNLFGKHLKSGGTYVIEDWGTGYWHVWPDGAPYVVAKEEHRDRSAKRFPLIERIAKRLGFSPRSPARRPGADPDFAAHNFGMAGFVKELVDEVAWTDITWPERGNMDLPRRASMIREMAVYCGQVFVRRA